MPLFAVALLECDAVPVLSPLLCAAPRVLASSVALFDAPVSVSFCHSFRESSALNEDAPHGEADAVTAAFTGAGSKLAARSLLCI